MDALEMGYEAKEDGVCRHWEWEAKGQEKKISWKRLKWDGRPRERGFMQALEGEAKGKVMHASICIGIWD
jgi:hypothetical protein